MANYFLDKYGGTEEGDTPDVTPTSVGNEPAGGTLQDNYFYNRWGVGEEPPAPVAEATPEDEDPTWQDYGRMVMSGGAQIGQGLGWLLEKAGAEDIGGAIKERSAESSRAWAQDRLDAIGLDQQGLSDTARQALNQDFLGEGELGDKWNKAKLTAASSLLGTMAGMGLGGALTKGIAGAMGLQAGTTGARVAAATGYGLGEAGVAAPSAGAATQEVVEQMTHEELMESPEYQAAFEALSDMPEDERKAKAKRVIADAAAGDAAAMTLLSTFVLSAPFSATVGKLAGKVPTPGGRVAGFAKGAGEEATQEFLQSGAEQLAQNIAVQQSAKPSQALGEDVLEQAVGGAMAGGIMGGPVGAFTGAEAPAEAGPLDDLTADEIKNQVDATKAVRDAEIEAAQEMARRDAEAKGADPLEQELAAAQAGLQYTDRYEADVGRLTRLWNQRLAADEEARYAEDQVKEDEARQKVQMEAAQRYEQGVKQVKEEQRAAAEKQATAAKVVSTQEEMAATESAQTEAQRAEQDEVVAKQRAREKADMQMRKLRRMRQKKGLEPKTDEGLPAVSPEPGPAEVATFKGKKPRSPAMAEAFARAANEAATSPDNQLPEPTPAQIEAGNYKKGHAKIQGLDITIENPAGSTRKDKATGGKVWRQKMQDHYGYIKRTSSAEGENEKLDVFVGDQPDAPNVYVVDQLRQDTNEFDEHKVMVGYPNRLAAARAYRRNFGKNWEVGPVTEMKMDEFKQWTKEGDMAKPLQPNAMPSPKVPATQEQLEEVIQAKTRKAGRRPRIRYRLEEDEEVSAAPAPGEAPESFKPVKMSLEKLKNVPGDKQRKSMGEMREFVQKIESGEIKPVVIVETRNGEPVRIKEGNHTLRALRLLGETDVVVRVQELGAEPEQKRTDDDLQRLLRRNKGFTVDPATGADVTEGYAVGIGRETRLRGYATATAIQGFKRNNADVLGEPDNYLGAWFFEGETYLDVSKVFPDTEEGRQQAMELGKEQREIGIMRLGQPEGEGYIELEYTGEEDVYQGDTLSVTHYSNVPGLSILEGSRFGTGIKSEEAARLSRPDAADIRSRVYVYTGKHRKESGLGPKVYEWSQDGMYDLGRDPMRFRQQAKDTAASLGIAGDKQFIANQTDKLIKGAGYAGVYVPEINNIGYVYGDVELEKTLYRKAGRPLKGVPTTEAEAAISDLVFKMPLLRPVVLRSPADAPDAIRQQIESDGATGARGVYDTRSDRLYIFSENHNTVEDVQKTLMHEGVAHKGLRYLMGDRTADVLRSVYSGADRVALERIAKQYALDLEDPGDQLVAAEEYIASLAESGVESSILQRVVSAVRQLLRDMGLVDSWTDSDIRGLLRAAGSRLRGKPLSAITITEEAEVSGTGDVVELEERADVALRRVQKRIDTVEKLRGCLA